jgi:hypothetical protein
MDEAKQWITDVFCYKSSNSISELDTTGLRKQEIDKFGVFNSFVCNLQKMDPTFCYQIHEQSLYGVQGFGRRSFMTIYPIINTARTISLPKSLNTFQSSLLLIIVMIPIKVCKA